MADSDFMYNFSMKGWDLTKYKVPEMHPSEYPLYIVLSAYEIDRGDTVVAGSILSDILHLLCVRGNCLRGERRRYTKDPYMYTNFISNLSPLSIMQVLLMLGYRLVGSAQPPITSMNGVSPCIWTLESCHHQGLNKTTAAMMLEVANKGYPLGKDHRLMDKPRPLPLELEMASGSHHNKIVSYMDMIINPSVDVFVEKIENIRSILKQRVDRQNREVMEGMEIWRSKETRLQYMARAMRPTVARIPERCMLPTMSQTTNPLLLLPAEWYEFRGGRPPVRRSPTEKPILAKKLNDVIEEVTDRANREWELYFSRLDKCKRDRCKTKFDKDTVIAMEEKPPDPLSPESFMPIKMNVF